MKRIYFQQRILWTEHECFFFGTNHSAKTEETLALKIIFTQSLGVQYVKFPYNSNSTSYLQKHLTSCGSCPLGDRHPDLLLRHRRTTMSPLFWSLSSMSSPTRKKILPWRKISYLTCSFQQTAWSCWRKRRGKCWRKKGETSRRNNGTGILMTSGFALRRGKEEGNGSQI